MLVVLGLGSNQGDSRFIILEAMTVLEQEVLAELRRSSLYKTSPLHVTDQNWFINSAVAGLYNGTPWELLSSIHEVETRFGRDRANERRWGERSLDIDILLFGDLVMNQQDLSGPVGYPQTADRGSSPDLVIPHPRLKERRFALQPLLELLPDAVEPGTGLSYRSICEALPDQEVKHI